MEVAKPKDPPAIAHHLRLEVADLKPFEEALSAFPHTKAIVRHRTGKKGEHPHLHVFFQLERELTKVGLKDRLRAFNDVFKSLKGQGEWTFRPHDSFEIWCKYVVKNPTHTVIKSDPILDATPRPLIVADPTVTPLQPKVIVRKAKARIDERMVAYCENELKWVRNAHFTLIHYEENICQSQCGKVMTQFTRGRFNDGQAIGWLRNLLYEFADDDLKDVLDRKYPSTAIKYL